MERVKKRYRLSFTPHAIRHLFVTQHLVWIKEEAADDQEEQQRLKAGLVQIMGWHSRETMQIYDHTFAVQEAVHKLHSFQREAERRALMAVQEHCLQPSQDDITIIEDTESRNAFAQLWEDLV